MYENELHISAALKLGKEHLGTHSIGGWMGPRDGLDAVTKR